MAIVFERDAPINGDLNVRWIHGSWSAKRNSDAKIQVHRYDEHTYILRQNKAINYEAPFLYLLFGNDRAFLLDTGATEDPGLFPLRETVDRVIDDWLTANPRENYELVVAHTHSHGDHIAADGQFADRANTTVIPTDLPGVQGAFEFTDWPGQVVGFDLGGRSLEITGIPGHHKTSIAIFDRWTGFLLTGDSVYPGRLYARDFPAFLDSTERLLEFAAARPVSHVMGCHIEMSRKPRRDYPLGSTFQPDEPPLEMTMAQLAAIRDAVRSLREKPGIHKFDDFVIWHGDCKAEARWEFLRARLDRLRSRIADL